MQLLERILAPAGMPIGAWSDFPDEVGQLFCDDWAMISSLLDVLIDHPDNSMVVYEEAAPSMD